MTEQKLNPHDVALIDFNFSLHQARNFLTLEEIADIIREVMPTDSVFLAEDIIKRKHLPVIKDSELKEVK